ncbi:hypothetical protein OK016_22855 [Vibrio chagasii]|nr:hypothetical protein [Vibrio chagasii]
MQATSTSFFNVPFWWIDHYKRPVSDSAVDITNAVSVELGLGASTLERASLSESLVLSSTVKSSIALLSELLSWAMAGVLYVPSTMSAVLYISLDEEQKALSTATTP